MKYSAQSQACGDTIHSGGGKEVKEEGELGAVTAEVAAASLSQ